VVAVRPQRPAGPRTANSGARGGSAARAVGGNGGDGGINVPRNGGGVSRAGNGGNGGVSGVNRAAGGGGGGNNVPRSGGGNRVSGGGNGGGNGGGRAAARADDRRSRITQAINLFLIGFSVLVVIAIIVVYRLSTSVLSNENVYAGVQIRGEDVSGLAFDELVSSLEQDIGGDLKDHKITLRINDIEKVYTFDELGVSYNIEEVARQAYEIGRTGSGFDRIRKISDIAKNPVNLNLNYTYDHSKVTELVDQIADEAGVLTADAEVRYTDDSVIIKPGREGVRIDTDDLEDRLSDALNNYESAEIDVKLIMSQPKSLDAEQIYQTIFREPVDARYAVSEDHKSLVIEDGKPGQSVDMTRLSLAIDNLNSHSQTEVKVPLLILQPKVRRADLEGNFFADLLGTASTSFTIGSTNNRNRRDNMTLATQMIAGYIMAPGDEFAFNEVVGQRTTAKGYKMAGAYMNGELIDDVGGGICQVSSTLYNAVLYADLLVSQRQNHSFIVNYVTKGLDATVSYPLPDFKFQNNSQHPIRVDCAVEGTQITFSLYGTQTGPKKKITFTSEVRATIPFEVSVTEDPTRPVGSTEVTQSGKTGYTIDSYKIVQIGDGPKEKIKLATNKYKTMVQKEIVGTMPVPSGADAPEATMIVPTPGDDDYVTDPNATPGPGATSAPGELGGEGATTPPKRTPRPVTGAGRTTTAAESDGGRATTTTENDGGGAGGTTSGGSATSADTTSGTTSGGDSGSGAGTTTASGGDGGDTPRTPRPIRTPRPDRTTEAAAG
jgi:vancomycin resistance protein YoaR